MDNTLISMLPKMLTGEELMEQMKVLPEYDEEIARAPIAERLMALPDLYRLYIPSHMSAEIYSKMYISLMRSLQKKQTRLATLQQNENRKAVLGMKSNGIMGGVDSFTIIGQPGIGKSATIERAIDLIHGNRILITNHPYCKVIPVISVQCPFDSSVKGLLLEILRKVDEMLGSRYHDSALRARMTTDMLIGSVSQVALNHIGLLVVDEIQHVAGSKNGSSLVGVLTQLINSSGIAICMVGTPECTVFFESTMYLARRALGLQYSPLPYDEEFCSLCRTMLSYRYICNDFEVTESILYWIHEHTGGVVASVVSLIHDAQEITLLNGSERLTMKVLNEAYENRMAMLRAFAVKSKKKGAKMKTKDPVQMLELQAENDGNEYDCFISDTVTISKNQSLDIIDLLQLEIEIEVMAV